MIVERVAERWWSPVLRGVLAIVFGVLTVYVPAAAVLGLVVLYGIYALADGITSFVMLSSARGRRRWFFGIAGVLSIAAGLIALFWPGITAAALFFVIAWWAILLGITELAGAVAYSDVIENEWPVVVSGLLWVGFGLLLVIWPATGVVAVLALIATAAILRGITLIVAGARLRRLQLRI